MRNKYLKEFNKEDSIIVISSFPRKKEKYSKGVCAVASFTKNTLLAIKKQNQNKRIVVLTMKLGNKEEVYKEDGMLIIRCFKRNSSFSYFNLLQNIRKFNHVKHVLLEFEFSSFGDISSTGSLSIVIWLLSIFNKRVTIVIHQVLLDLKEISGHIGISKKSLKIKFLNFALKNFYKFITYPAKNIIVLENELKNRLQNIIPKEKIVVIPHGVDKQITTALNKKKSKLKLGMEKDELVILYFGYLTWYKGVDFLVKSLQKHNRINGKKVKLVIAGGPSFTQDKKEHYQAFLRKTENLAKGLSHIEITGFVPEEKIADYFKASDVVVFPYRKFMSSSGPFSLALSFGKPVLLSENLQKLIKSNDIKEVLNKTGLLEKDIIFKLNENSLVEKIISVQKISQQKKLASFSNLLSEKRSFDSLASIYIKTILQNYAKIYNRKLLVSPSITR
ncbi:MAG: glycosyltransferase [Candidatus Levyibacteriota bacterium]